MLEKFYIGDVVAEDEKKADESAATAATAKEELALNPKKKIAFALKTKEQVRATSHCTAHLLSPTPSNVRHAAVSRSFRTTLFSSRSRCRRPPRSSAFPPASTSSSAP